MADIVDLSPVLRMSDRTDPHLVHNSRSGGVALNGAEQILSPLSQRWRFQAVFPIRGEQEARAIRVAKSTLLGRFNYLRLRICDQFRITRSDVGAVGSGPIPHSDGAFFSDGSGYALSQPSPPVTVAAAAGATTLTVRASDFNGAMTVGVFFSVNDWLYQIDGWELDAGVYTLTISPPLREAVAVGDEANFDATCLWQLESDDVGQFDLRGGRLGTVTLTLLEPVTR